MGLYFSVALLVTNLFLSWAVYPLNKEPLIWDRQNLSKVSSSIEIRKFDRTALVGTESCYKAEDLVDCANLKYFDTKFGPRRHVVGYQLTPGLNFSAGKSFTQKEVAFFTTTFIEIEGRNSKGILRTLQGFPNFHSSRVYDFTGVKYLLSWHALPASKNIKLLSSGLQFYLYQNLNAWPYYYLADRIETINDMKELYKAEKGVAYLWKDSEKLNFSDNKTERKSLIKLSNFDFGEIEFRSSSDNEEFLVVLDAWHPYWRAQVDDNPVEVLKTNGVFKGVFVPAGKHVIRLYFDNKSYRPGIWISLFSWILFLGAWASLSPKYFNPSR